MLMKLNNLLIYSAILGLLFVFMLFPASAGQNSTNVSIMNTTTISSASINTNLPTQNNTIKTSTSQANNQSGLSKESVKSGNVNYGPELSQIRSSIAEQGASWVAADTSISVLPQEDRIRLLGVKSYANSPILNQSFNQSGEVQGDNLITALPGSLDWRNNSGRDWTTPVRNQASCGSCWAFGTLGAVESRVKIGLNDSSLSPDYSEQELVSCAVSNGCAGAYMNQPFTYMQQTGVVDESVFRYTSGGGSVPPCIVTSSPRHKITSWTVLSGETNIKNALSRGPITATFDVYNDFFSYSSGVYEHVTGSYAGGHAVTMVGWGQDDKGLYWICKNSWGPGWGESGWFRIRSENVGINDYLMEATPVLPSVIADFQGMTPEGASPLNVSFIDKSQNNPTTWQWYFGDNSANVTTKNTSHMFLAPGNYTVTLTSSNSFSSSSIQKMAYVKVYSSTVIPQKIIVNHTTTHLAQIPKSAIDTAKSTLHIAYGHTSHGSQIIDGMTGLTSFAGAPYGGSTYQWNNGGTGSALDLRDTPFSNAYDLGNPNFTAWANATRTYLNTTPAVNVVIWSWCGEVSTASATDITTYLTHMNQLENEYPGVKFVYMTGHLDGSGQNGVLNIRNEQIRAYCSANNKTLYDFADIESFDPDASTNYMMLNATDACDYPGGNWAINWQNNHTQGIDWYNCGAAHSQPLNANQKAYAAWWLWARLAGWDGTPVLPPVANFTANVTSGNVPLTVSFTDTSTGSPTSWNWNFGDGGTSSMKNPVYTYTSAGKFNVSLNASNSAGNYTLEKTGYITSKATIDKIGVFRNGFWIVDYDGNFQWSGPSNDRIASLGQAGDTPVVGDLTGDGREIVGIFRNGLWIIDNNGNFRWDNPPADSFASIGQEGDIAVVGDWNGDGKEKIGIFRNGLWVLDYNGNFQWDGTSDDRVALLGQSGDTAVVGDWYGDGKDRIGIFRNGLWVLDYSGNFQWDGTSIDRVASLGQSGDTAVVGDWYGDGKDRIGIFRNGLWVLDYSGNFQWDGTSNDRVASLGQSGDTAVVGRWN
jgi:PKD repeat protein